MTTIVFDSLTGGAEDDNACKSARMSYHRQRGILLRGLCQLAHAAFSLKTHQFEISFATVSIFDDLALYTVSMELNL